MAVEKREKRKEEKKSMIIVVPSCLKDADGARTRSDQKSNHGEYISHPSVTPVTQHECTVTEMCQECNWWNIEMGNSTQGHWVVFS
jgi:hypothetical protein